MQFTLQNGKELWVDSALRNKHPFQRRNNKVICYSNPASCNSSPPQTYLQSALSCRKSASWLYPPSNNFHTTNKTHPRRFNCFYCVSQTLSSTSHTAFLRHQWRSYDSLEKSESRTRADVSGFSHHIKGLAPLRRGLVEGEGKWKLNSRVWSKGRKGQDKLQTNGSSPNRFYGAMTRLLCLSLVGQ